MKKFYWIIWVLLLGSCYKEDIDSLYAGQQELEVLLQELQEQCKLTNSTVELLKDLIGGSTIKETHAFNEAETGKSGWEVIFTDGSSFKLYNGQQGTAPVISVTRIDGDADGWYWTVNGELLKDAAGDPMRLNGKDGGTPEINAEGFWVIGGVVTDKKASGEVPEISEDGYWVIGGDKTTVKAVVTDPRLAVGSELIDEGIIKDKNGQTIENIAWYLSADGGLTWVKVSAGGDAGSGGTPGNCLIKSVTESADGESIVFELSNGQMIKVPSWTWAQKLVEQVNNLAETLNNWVTNAKYIKEVVALKDEGANAIGWKIIYSDDTYSEIFNGKDGAAGPKGDTPQISVVKEGDDYYWTIDGEKLLVDGTGVKATAITPQLHLGEELPGKTDVAGNPVEAGIWYLSVDNEHWVRISGDKGETGDKGEPGADGDAFFQKAPDLDEENGWVTFTLKDGTEIKVALYDWVKDRFDRINTEITTIKTLLDEVAARKYIVSVDPVYAGTEPNRYIQQYKITFSDNTVVDLGNSMIGLRGGKGTDGEDLGDLYWTINGVDMLYNGHTVKANGKDGGSAPQVKPGSELPAGTIPMGEIAVIASAKYLSVDGGTTWVRLTGDQGDQGNQGEPGKDGTILSVDGSAEDLFVTFHFQDKDIVIPTQKWATQTTTELARQNSEISAVREFLKGGMIIENVITTTENGKHIYTLECRSLDGTTKTYEIRDGADGNTPLIEVKDGGDGNYYWVVNGKELTDADGHKIPVNGQQGIPGKDAVVPQLEKGETLINNGIQKDAQGVDMEAYAIYLSVDSERQKWTRVSGADGAPGEPGKDGTMGDSFFKEVSLSADGYWLHFVMQDKNGGVDIEVDVPTKKWAEEIKKQLEALEVRIDAIDALLNDGIIVKSITPFADREGKSGYDLVYTQNGTQTTIQLYNGKDGKVPDIGIKKDTDGNFYWTLDGEYITDGEGIPVRANGNDGSEGATGKDAPLPRLASGQELQEQGITPDQAGGELEVAAVYLSVDAGAIWTKVSGPKGDPGQDGTAGDPAKPGFTAVLSEDKDWVVFTFEDGSTIQVPTEQRLLKIEEQLKTLAENLENLKTLLNTTKFIKEIKPLTEEGQSGWEVVLMDINGQVFPDTYKIYNGVDGTPGDQGDKGEVPVISVAKDPDHPEDETLYWTVDGAFMKDAAGQNVPATGKNAPTPQIQVGAVLQPTVSKDAEGKEIDAVAYYLSVDGKEPWYRVSGEKGEQGDSLIESIDETNPEYVLFKLTNGTEFKVAKYIEVNVSFDVVENTYMIEKNTAKTFGFTVSGSYSAQLQLTTMVGGNWKVLQQYSDGSGSLTIQAPSTWDHNKVMMLLSDQKGRVWTFTLTVETTHEIGDPFVDRRDERIYTISYINNKWWMTEDLKYKKVTGYTYEEARADGLCPEGWRVPDNDDWADLNDHANSGIFGSASVGGGWWSSTLKDAESKATVWTINASKWSSEQISVQGTLRSVRCVKNGLEL